MAVGRALALARALPGALALEQTLELPGALSGSRNSREGAFSRPVDLLGAERILRDKVALGASYAYGFDAHACRTYVVPKSAGLVRLYML